ncbi:hypothetical protein L226DRAFT_122596 [Lentinus tigrinus ALCF2SS1-7]|uniref:uncharacterized protein n=1 Tax=Lentinus tigrinus ALCF2SS1-7 TaxID=1328758 RepID=UPI0011661F41|nr:hypothetical protein L226DRAFT_122596 [Lentinus tigrinus ALCF2SS1-7]
MATTRTVHILLAAAVSLTVRNSRMPYQLTVLVIQFRLTFADVALLERAAAIWEVVPRAPRRYRYPQTPGEPQGSTLLL